LKAGSSLAPGTQLAPNEEAAGMSQRPSFVTRRALTLDGPAIAEIYLRAVRQAMPWLRLAHDDTHIRAWFSDEHPVRHEVWLAEAGGSVSAFVALSLDRGWVDHLYVDPSFQGCGQGSELIALAQSLSSGTLRLWAFQRNLPARSFYEHRGFRAVEFGDGSANEEGEPDVLYLWQRSG
jgi:putative acetyltransferase